MDVALRAEALEVGQDVAPGRFRGGLGGALAQRLELRHDVDRGAYLDRLDLGLGLRWRGRVFERTSRRVVEGLGRGFGDLRLLLDLKTRRLVDLKTRLLVDL